MGHGPVATPNKLDGPDCVYDWTLFLCLVAVYQGITVITAVITALPGIWRGISKNALMLHSYRITCNFVNWVTTHITLV